MTLLYQIICNKANYFLVFLTISALFSCNEAFSASTPDRKIIFIAYQGVLEMAPENTFAAFRKAVEFGATGLMVEVRRTKDKKIVLVHDATIDRTTDGRGRIDQMLYDELRLYDAGSWRGKEFKGEKVPLLSETLQFAKVNGIKLILDVKQFGIERAVLDLVKEADMLESVYFWGKLRNIKKLEPGLPVYSLKFLKSKEITKEMIEFAHTERNHIIVKLIDNDDREALIKCINKKADVALLNYPQIINDIYHENSLKSVKEPDPIVFLELQKKDAESTTKVQSEDDENISDAIFIRDETSTLINVLTEENVENSRMAALAIAGSLNDNKAMILIEHLNDKHELVRRNAAWGLGFAADKRGVQPLLELLEDKDNEVKRNAIMSLKKLSNSIELTDEEKDLITNKIIEVLNKSTDIGVRYDAARALSDLGNNEAIHQLIKTLKTDSDWSVKSVAAQALGKIGDKQGTKPLLNLFTEDEGIEASWARKQAGWALANIGVDAINGLVAALSDNEKSARRKASWALIKIGKPAVPALVLALKHVDKNVRKLAAISLGWIRDEYAVKALLWELKDREPEPRLAAAWALGRIGDPKALETLESKRRDRSFSVRRNVIEAINRIKDKQKKD